MATLVPFADLILPQHLAYDPFVPQGKWPLIRSNLMSLDYLTPTDKALYEEILFRCGGQGFCCPSANELAKSLAMGRATIFRALDKLKKEGFIAVAHRQAPSGRKRSNVYLILRHPDLRLVDVDGNTDALAEVYEG